MSEMTEEFEISSSVRGYHVYKHIWTALIGEELPCSREPNNSSDRYTVGVLKDGAVVGHLPKNISRVNSLFLRRGGSIMCGQDAIGGYNPTPFSHFL